MKLEEMSDYDANYNASQQLAETAKTNRLLAYVAALLTFQCIALLVFLAMSAPILRAIASYVNTH